MLLPIRNVSPQFFLYKISAELLCLFLEVKSYLDYVYFSSPTGANR